MLSLPKHVYNHYNVEGFLGEGWNKPKRGRVAVHEPTDYFQCHSKCTFLTVKSLHTHSRKHIQTMALPLGTPGWLRPPTLFLLILYATFFPFFLLPVTSTFSFYPSPSISYCLVGRFCLLTLFTGFSPIISYSLEPLFSLFLFHWFPCFSSISVNLLHSDSPHFSPPFLVPH